MAKWTFRVAGIYGLAVLTPNYFLERQIGQHDPPAVTHPEYFYGFLGVAIAWQIAFLLISRDPARFRPLMIAAILEKATFGFATIALYWQRRVSAGVLGFGLIDLALGVSFTVAFFRTAAAASDSRNEQPLQT